MGTEMGVFLTFGGIIILIFLLGRTLLIPLKMILKLMLNSLAGGILLMVINFLGGQFGVFIPLNIINTVTVGALGIPGVVMLLLFCN